jgi:6-phosphogluconolactonase
VAVGIPKNSDLERLTLTIPAINAAGTVAFLVSGSKKAEIIRSINEGNDDTPRYPAQHIKPLSGSITWLLDRNAASDL